MLPSGFSTEEEIIRKLRSVGKLHDFKNAQTLCHIFYDVFKTAYYALKRKKENLKQVNVPIVLNRKEITRLVKLIDYYHSNDKSFNVEHELSQCFGPNFSEDDALKFFEIFVEGDTKDKFGRLIHIDLEDGMKFMYKNYEKKTHEMKSEYYQPQRGKRLPWIKHTIHNSTNIYTKIDGINREIMYLCKYNLPNYGNESNKCYWAVIVKKNRKDKIAPYEFKTAFPVFNYNRLLKRLERYNPIIEII